MKLKFIFGKESRVISFNFFLIFLFLALALIPFSTSEELPIENPESNVVWKDNCQVKCVDGKCNTIIGKTIWVNDSDNKCDLIEEASSLKNSNIKPIIESDEIHLVEILDYNYTHIKLKTSLDEKFIEESKKEIPKGKEKSIV